MRGILSLLLILSVVGILWIVSGYWRFSSTDYVNPKYVEDSQVLLEGIDLEFLKKEFTPAYEF